MKNADDIWPVEVFYDGACPVCSREIDGYRRKSEAGKLRYIDIAAADFDAARYGLDPDAVMQALHVRLANGEVRVGVEAFRVIWRATPGMRVWARVVGWPGVNLLARIGYRLFAAVRPRLPGRGKTSCSVKR